MIYFILKKIENMEQKNGLIYQKNNKEVKNGKNNNVSNKGYTT